MVVNCVAYSRGRQQLRDITLDEISDVLAKPDSFVWVGLHEPDEPLLEKLQEEFGLHELAVEDAHNAHQRPKIETYGDSLFIVVHTAQVVGGNIASAKPTSSSARATCVTVRHGASLSYAPARRSCERDAGDARARTELRAVRGARLHRRQLLADRARVPRGTAGAREGNLRGDLQARDHPPPVRPQDANW